MHGIGNDFVLIDFLRDGQLDCDLAAASQKLCDRHFGVGADGVILVEKSSDMLQMRMFNPDGSESEMCGNGLRTFAKLCQDRGYAKDHFPVRTGAGVLEVNCLPDGCVSVNMGQAILGPSEIGMIDTNSQAFVNQDIGGGFNGTAVSLGNPHLVIFVDDVAKVELDREGPRFEHYAKFPNRTNVHFVQIVSRSEITLRTWERGAGITLACGTGACASVVAAFLNGRTERQVNVNLPGGKLQVKYLEDGTVQMTGAAEYAFDGISSTLL